MSTRKARRSGAQPSPHLYDVDLTPFRGRTVLGEPLDVLFSALLRMEFKNLGNGMASFDAYWPEAEARCVSRAMGRVIDEVPDDERSQDERNCDRFVAMTWCVLGAVDALQSGIPKPLATMTR